MSNIKSLINLGYFLTAPTRSYAVTHGVMNVNDQQKDMFATPRFINLHNFCDAV